MRVFTDQERAGRPSPSRSSPRAARRRATAPAEIRRDQQHGAVGASRDGATNGSMRFAAQTRRPARLRVAECCASRATASCSARPSARRVASPARTAIASGLVRACALTFEESRAHRSAPSGRSAVTASARQPLEDRRRRVRKQPAAGVRRDQDGGARGAFAARQVGDLVVDVQAVHDVAQPGGDADPVAVARGRCTGNGLDEGMRNELDQVAAEAQPAQELDACELRYS
jgi:hypothetical protein